MSVSFSLTLANHIYYKTKIVETAQSIKMKAHIRAAARGVCATARDDLSSALQDTLEYATSFPSTDSRLAGAFLAIHLFGGLLLRPFPAAAGARIRSLVQLRVRLWFSTSGEDGLTGIDTLLRDIRDGGELARACLGAFVPRRPGGRGRGWGPLVVAGPSQLNESITTHRLTSLKVTSDAVLPFVGPVS
jgi:hypothetical protein